MSGISHEVGARRLSWTARPRRSNAVWSALGDRVGGALVRHSEDVKRGLDVMLAGLALVALLPLLAVIALAVRLDSRGPLMLCEARVGQGGSLFALRRFRTVALDGGAVTRVGRILRAHGLDGLPRLVSVVTGTMSLVGPRSALPSDVRNFDEQLVRRTVCRPGLTGLWRVNGRSDLGWADSVRLDLYYVENRSTTLDLVLMGRTLRDRVSR